MYSLSYKKYFALIRCSFPAKHEIVSRTNEDHGRTNYNTANLETVIDTGDITVHNYCSCEICA